MCEEGGELIPSFRVFYGRQLPLDQTSDGEYDFNNYETLLCRCESEQGEKIVSVFMLRSQV